MRALRARSVFPACARDANVRTTVGVTTAWCSERTKALISIKFASIYGSCAVEPPINPSEQPGAQQQRSRPAVRCRKASCCFRSWRKSQRLRRRTHGDSVAAMGTRAVMEAGACVSLLVSWSPFALSPSPRCAADADPLTTAHATRVYSALRLPCTRATLAVAKGGITRKSRVA